MPSTGNEPAGKPRIFYGYFIVGAAFLILMAMVGSYLSFGVFLKPVSAAFGWSRGAVSIAAAMAWFSQGFAGIIQGKLCDRYGPGKTMAGNGLIIGAGFLLMSQISELWQLYVIYGIVIGCGISSTFIVLTSTIARWFDARRSTMVGAGIAGASVGSMVIPVIASNLIAAYDWRTCYIILGCFVVVAVGSLSMFLKRDPASIGLKPYGATEARRDEPDIGAAYPTYRLSDALKTRQFWMIGPILFMLGYCINTSQVHIVAHASDLGVPDTLAATVISVIGGTGFAGSILVGMMADRIGNQKTYLVVFFTILAAYAWLLPSGSMWQFIVFAIPFGFVINGGIAIQSPLLADYFGMRSLGVIIGALSVFFCFGSAAGAYVPGFIFDTTGSYRIAFIVCGVLCVISIVMLILLRPVKSVPRLALD